MARADKNSINEYLLGRLTEPDEEQLELRLLTDPEFAEEYDIVVNEVVDDYVAGKFEGEDLKQVEEYFFKSPERKKKLRFALALKQRKSEMVTPKPRSKNYTPYLAIAASVLLVVGGFFIWRAVSSESDVDKGLAALQAAFRDERPFESRISELNYAPFVSTRGPGDEKFDKNELALAELMLRQELKNRPTPAARHAVGKVFLAKKDFDEAIKQFDEALKEDPRNAQLYSDLGAAWLEKGKIDREDKESGKGIEGLARSSENLNKALELDPNLLEARFNRAIVHQYLMLPNRAEDSWREYLNHDSTSSWADEARRNLKSLQEQKQKSSQTKEQIRQDFRSAYEAQDSERAWEVIRHSRDAFSIGKLVRDQLLDEYLQVATNGEEHTAKSKLKALAFVGQLELDKTGDVYSAELSRFYSLTSPSQREILTEGRELMKRGQGYYAQGKPLDAIDVFKKSQLLFEGIGNGWEAQYAELWIGYSYLNASETQRSVTIFKKLATSFERRNHKWLFMRALHLLSAAEYNLTEYSQAIDHNRRSLALAEQMGDAIGALNTLTILIEQYRHIGNYSQSLNCVQQSLAFIGSTALNEIQVAQHHGIIAASLSSSGFHRAAADYQSEALRRALITGQVQAISRIYADLGSIYGELGSYTEALRNASLAYQTARSHSDESIKHRMMAYASLELGNLHRQAGDITKAIESYDECLELYNRLDNHYGLYEAHKGRLSCYILLKNDVAAKEELLTTLNLVEKYRSRIREGENRNHFFDIEQSVYDLAIDFEYSRMSNSQKAFEYSEASRSRTLLDLVNTDATVSNDTSRPDIVFGSLSRPLMLRDIQARLPKQAQIIQYAVLSNKVLIWVITRTNFTTFESNVAQKELTQRVYRYIQGFSHGSTSQTPETTADAKQLFEILIKPAEPLLEKSHAIYVVPDKVLNYLPFSALISPDSNRFLVEHYLTVVSPSSSLLIHSSDAARRKQVTGAERILSVGNPSFDRSEFPELADLPSAGREARQVASYYDSYCLLTGDEAGEPRVEMEMERSHIIHLAVHSVFNQHTPLRSRLLLTKQRRTTLSGDSSTGVLEAREIYQMKLAPTRMVVLSACQSGVEQNYGGEGMISLARPFLAVGVPLVVASLWPVDSDATAELMISFHKHRRENSLSSSEALRRAQLDMLSSPDQRLNRPNCWASFTAVGGSTSF